uniref:Vitamin D-binding protein n=1 Tax=Sphenodon punctatus TaxID=8508 RepID=A0A8D0GTV8_SPHPU
MRDKVCQEFTILGKDNFRSLAILVNSKKYSNGTFEEISHLVNKIVSLAEKCCAEGVDPDCYETESLAMSAKSCAENSPFPDHPGTEACCTQQGLERKLCLAALYHPPKDVPTYTEPPTDELCEKFKENPKDFAERFLYEYGSSYGQAPLPLLAASARSYLSMVGTCCLLTNSVSCFLESRLERKSLSLLPTIANRVCSHYAAYGKEKSKISSLTTFAQKIPSSPLEDILSLAEDFSEVLSKCCNSMAEECMQNELSNHTAKICCRLSDKDDRVAECCKGKNPMENYFCIYSLQRGQSPELPQFQRPTGEQLCGEDGRRQLDQYVFEIARRYTYIPELFVSKLHDAAQNVVNACCSTENSPACLATKVKWRHVFPSSLYRKKMPDATEEFLTGLVEQRDSFASTCCMMNAPPTYCSLKVESCLPLKVLINGMIAVSIT